MVWLGTENIVPQKKIPRVLGVAEEMELCGDIAKAEIQVDDLRTDTEKKNDRMFWGVIAACGGERQESVTLKITKRTRK